MIKRLIIVVFFIFSFFVNAVNVVYIANVAKSNYRFFKEDFESLVNNLNSSYKIFGLINNVDENLNYLENNLVCLENKKVYSLNFGFYDKKELYKFIAKKTANKKIDILILSDKLNSGWWGTFWNGKKYYSINDVKKICKILKPKLLIVDSGLFSMLEVLLKLKGYVKYLLSGDVINPVFGYSYKVFESKWSGLDRFVDEFFKFSLNRNYSDILPIAKFIYLIDINKVYKLLGWIDEFSKFLKKVSNKEKLEFFKAVVGDFGKMRPVMHYMFSYYDFDKVFMLVQKLDKILSEIILKKAVSIQDYRAGVMIWMPVKKPDLFLYSKFYSRYLGKWIKILKSINY